MWSWLLEFLKWLLSTAVTPIALIIVWVYDIRPFQIGIEFLGGIIGKDSPLKAEIDAIPQAAVGAIDVAVTVFIFNAIGYFIKKLSKPISFKVEILDAYTEQPSASLDFDEDNIGQDSPYPLKLKMGVKVSPFFWWTFKHVLRGIRINVIWHPSWLSVTTDFRDKSGILRPKIRPGSYEFNLLDVMSESDIETKLEGKLSVLVNSGIKKQGNVDCKLGINNDYAFIRWLFQWVVLLVVKEETTPCKLILKKRG